MKTSFWGPQTWQLIHAIAHTFPDQPTEAEQSAVHGLMDAMIKLLPCALCRGNLAKELDALPPDTSSRSAMIKWAWTLHNSVNRRLGKPEYPIEKLNRKFLAMQQRPEIVKNCTVILAGMAALLAGIASQTNSGGQRSFAVAAAVASITLVAVSVNRVDTCASFV